MMHSRNELPSQANDLRDSSRRDSDFSPTEPWTAAVEPQSTAPQSDVQFWQVNDFSAGTIPESYEPRYAYPLVVWLTGQDCGIDDSLNHIAAMSPQNYLGLAVDECLFERPASDQNDFDMPVEFLKRLVDVENRVVNAVRSVRQVLNVHTERIFLAGAGDAASVALLLAMHQPEWFGGCIAFGGAFPSAAKLLANQDELAGKRFFLGAPGGRSAWQTTSSVSNSARQLVAAGADVSVSVNASETESLVNRLTLREVDQWIISGILADA
jgi:phospholipase/carboxylesterase